MESDGTLKVKTLDDMHFEKYTAEDSQTTDGDGKKFHLRKSHFAGGNSQIFDSDDEGASHDKENQTDQNLGCSIEPAPKDKMKLAKQEESVHRRVVGQHLPDC